MAKLTDEMREKIIAKWRTGRFTIRHLASDFDVSRSLIGNIVKGIEQDAADIVDKGVQYNQGLKNLTGQNAGYLSSFVREMVASESETLTYFKRAAVQNVHDAMSVHCESQQDFRNRGEVIAKAKETVFGKAPDNQTNVQINNALPAVSVTFGD